MPLDRVAGESFGVRVDHSDGPRERSCVRGPPLLRVQSGKGPALQATGVGAVIGSVSRMSPNNLRYTIGAYCLLRLIPSHSAIVGEIMQALWSDFHGACAEGERRPRQGVALSPDPLLGTTEVRQ
jgi:hypothetical protein